VSDIDILEDEEMTPYQAERDYVRSVPFELERADDEGDGLTLRGYAAVFNSPTRIDSWEGQFDEVISRGAFKQTIDRTQPVLQFDHGRGLIGSLPIGTITRLREDKKGLYVEARLFDNWAVQPVRDAIAGGAINGMSFRFRVPEGGDTWKARKNEVPLRTLTALDVPELGPVVFPAYRETEVSVRSKEIVDELLTDESVRRDVAFLLAAPQISTRSDVTLAADERKPTAESVTPEATACQEPKRFNPSHLRLRVAAINALRSHK
jgi:HK97 family phage prohead protease